MRLFAFKVKWPKVLIKEMGKIVTLVNYFEAQTQKLLKKRKGRGDKMEALYDEEEMGHKS